MTLTDISIRNLKPPERGQQFHADNILNGFGVRISQGGTKTFVIIFGPRRERVTIGRYPTISLSEARTEAKRRLAEITLGKARPKTINFEDAKQKFIADCEVKNRIRTVQDYRRLLKHFPFGRTQLAQITRHDIAQRLSKLSATPSESNHALVAVKVFFRWAERQGYLESNPCSALLAKKAESSRDKVLSEVELGRVLKQALDEPYPYGSIVALLILTGQRRGEIAALRWSWIDMSAHTISFPASITKNKRPHVLPIGPIALGILKRLPSFDDQLFPASRSHVAGKPTSVFNGWPKCKVAFDKKLDGISPYTLHDLRRTFSSQMAELGTPIHVTEKLLNHVSGSLSGVAGVYNRYSYATEMRSAVEAYETRLQALISSSINSVLTAQ